MPVPVHTSIAAVIGTLVIATVIVIGRLTFAHIQCER